MLVTAFFKREHLRNVILSKQFRFLKWTAALCMFFLFFAWIRVVQHPTNVDFSSSYGDDWYWYKVNALDICENGLLMKANSSNYYLPAGFLYNYFIALVFHVFGKNDSYVYMSQSVLLAFSIGLYSIAFKRYLSEIAGNAYFIFICIFIILDALWIYSFRMLSEVLVVFLLGLILFIVETRGRSRSLLVSVFLGSLLGCSILTRPNIVTIVPVIIAWYHLLGRSSRNSFLTFCVCCLVVMMLPLRNYLVTGDFYIPVFDRNYHWEIPPIDLSFLELGFYYAKRTLFAFGFHFILEKSFYFRPHWILMWAIALIHIGRALINRRIDMVDILCSVMIGSYLVPVILISFISNYGYRMILPMMPIALFLAIRGIDAGREKIGSILFLKTITRQT